MTEETPCPPTGTTCRSSTPRRLPHRRRHRDHAHLRRRLRAARLRRLHPARRPAGRAALDRYFDAYAAIAARDGVGIVLETPTWRASADWGARLGYDARAPGPRQPRRGRPAGRACRPPRDRRLPVVISGCIGPRGDGYQVGTTMTVDEARPTTPCRPDVRRLRGRPRHRHHDDLRRRGDRRRRGRPRPPGCRW